MARSKSSLFLYFHFIVGNDYTCQGLIFVVDSNDRERITEAQEELQKMVGFLKLVEGRKCSNLVLTVARRRAAGGNTAGICQQAGPAQCNDRIRAHRQVGTAEPEKPQGK